MSDQRTDEWFAKRKGKITASVAGAILGIDPYRKPDDVMRMMVRDYFGAEKEFTGNIATRWGEDNEDNAKAAYEAERDVMVVDEGFITHEEKTWLGASPDGLVQQIGLVEIKCPFGIRKDENPIFKLIGEVPHYHAQMQIQMACTNRIWCDFVQWTPYALNIQQVRFDPNWLADNLPKLEAFYELYLSIIKNEAMYKPYLEDKVEVAVERDDFEWADAVVEWKGAKKLLDQATEILEEKKQRLIELANGRKTHGYGLTVSETKSKGSVSYSTAIKTLLPDADLEPFRGKPSSYWAVKVDKGDN